MSAMVEVVAHGGYRDATVDRVLARSRVGWEEFTRLFEDLDGCFLATLDGGMECAAARAEAGARIAGGDASFAARFSAGLSAVLAAAADQPELTRLCLVEAPTLGVRALARKEAGLQRFVDWLERELAQAPGGGTAPALAAEMVVGGIYEVMQRNARSDQIADLPQLAAELTGLWLPALRQR